MTTWANKPTSDPSTSWADKPSSDPASSFSDKPTSDPTTSFAWKVTTWEIRRLVFRDVDGWTDVDIDEMTE